MNFGTDIQKTNRHLEFLITKYAGTRNPCSKFKDSFNFDITDNNIIQYAGHILREAFRLKVKVQIEISSHAPQIYSLAFDVLEKTFGSVFLVFLEHENPKELLFTFVIIMSKFEY